MERVTKTGSNLVPSSILSIIAGSLIIIGGLIPLTILGMSGHYGMMSGFGTGVMMRGGMMMTPLQPFMWTGMAAISVISIGIGVILTVGGYLIYTNPEDAGKWGI